MSFTLDQIAKLNGPLNKDYVKEREQAGRILKYVEGWQVISEANRIFGFDAWTSETVEVHCVTEKPRLIGKAQVPGFGVSYIAKVRITVGGVVREGYGSGHGVDRDLGLAYESAIKEAETDARKRALMTFGNPFGLALYDKTMANVGVIPDESIEQPQEPPQKPYRRLRSGLWSQSLPGRRYYGQMGKAEGEQVIWADPDPFEVPTETVHTKTAYKQWIEKLIDLSREREPRPSRLRKAWASSKALRERVLVTDDEKLLAELRNLIATHLGAIEYEEKAA